MRNGARSLHFWEGIGALALAAFLQTPAFAAPREDKTGMSITIDHQRIEDLMVRYMDVLDAGDYDAYAALFAPDATLSYGDHRLRGRQRIHDVVRDELEGLRHPKDADGRALPALGMHHLLLNPIIRVEGATATATATWIFVKVTSDGQTGLWGAGRYSDSFIRIGTEWLFRSREVSDTVADTIAGARRAK